jgi:hypothetical protein
MPLLFWFVLAAALVLVTGVAGFVAHRNKMKRRARELHLRATRERQRTSSAPSPLQGGMTPELIRAIRAHAERTAARHWQAGGPRAHPVNPYDAGSPEFVLWYATYELAMHEKVDAEEDTVQVVFGDTKQDGEGPGR